MTSQKSYNETAYERALHILHAMVSAGQEDSLACDEVRDELNDFWYELTKEEQTRMNNLSATLFNKEN
jgi:hypothetical protein